MYSFKFDSFCLDIFSEFVCVIHTILRNIKTRSLIHSMNIINTFKWRFEIHVFSSPSYLSLSKFLEFSSCQKYSPSSFCKLHIIFIIPIDGIMFDLCEFLQVTWIGSFVAKVLSISKTFSYLPTVAFLSHVQMQFSKIRPYHNRCDEFQMLLPRLMKQRFRVCWSGFLRIILAHKNL